MVNRKKIKNSSKYIIVFNNFKGKECTNQDIWLVHVNFQDNKITQEEWFKMWTECVQATNNHKDLPDWQQRYMDFMFEVNDTSGWLEKPIHVQFAVVMYKSYDQYCFPILMLCFVYAGNVLLISRNRVKFRDVFTVAFLIWHIEIYNLLIFHENGHTFILETIF